MKLLNKISVATVVGSKANIVPKEGQEERFLMRVVGSARKVEVGNSSYGEFLRFKGEFRALNLETGEWHASASLFLPKPVDEMLAEQINAMSEGNKAPVEFAFDISTIPSDKGEMGYQYRCATLLESRPSDPVAALLETVGKAPLPKLAAPVTEAPPAETPADTAEKPVTGRKK